MVASSRSSRRRPTSPVRLAGRPEVDRQRPPTALSVGAGVGPRRRSGGTSCATIRLPGAGPVTVDPLAVVSTLLSGPVYVHILRPRRTTSGPQCPETVRLLQCPETVRKSSGSRPVASAPELARGAGVAGLHARPYARPVNSPLIRGRQKAPLSGATPPHPMVPANLSPRSGAGGPSRPPTEKPSPPATRPSRRWGDACETGFSLLSLRERKGERCPLSGSPNVAVASAHPTPK